MTAFASRLTDGVMDAVIHEGGLRAVRFNGVEVLRGLTYPVRNRDWGTYVTVTGDEEYGPTHYRRQFAEREGVFQGRFQVRLEEGRRLVAEVEITFPKTVSINRAGFTLLHPIRGVAGKPLTVRHPGNRISSSAFPALISPSQPARDIAGLSHGVDGVGVDVTFEGDVFEMEDQRNWSDASFKTYCRPLSLPYPYEVSAGESIRQQVVISLSAITGIQQESEGTGPIRCRLPQVMLAHEPGLSHRDALAAFPDLPILFRLTPETLDEDVHALAGRAGTALEIVFDSLDGLDDAIGRVKAAGLYPVRVVALPRAFLKSYQPDAVWPEGDQPEAAYPILRAGFPGVAIGGGSLTNFTELNRCRPDPQAIDFVTFGNTAIVHAADDVSVRQTLEAMPDIFASASAIAAGRPLHLGLVSIGMRCNPYGESVSPNPNRIKIAMAMDDPRQETDFASDYAVAVLAQAAIAGVGSLALAMPDGPLGADGPLADVIHWAAAFAGQGVDISVTKNQTVIMAETGHRCGFSSLQSL